MLADINMAQNARTDSTRSMLKQWSVGDGECSLQARRVLEELKRLGDKEVVEEVMEMAKSKSHRVRLH